MDLKALKLDYVFYPRPYDSFMPKPYQSHIVSRHSRICLILYGMNTTQEVVSITLSRSFFRYVYCYFAELPYSRECNEKKGWLLHKLGLQHSVYFGMPGIKAIRSAAGQPSPAWSFSKNNFRVMWTPRWTTDPALGGSNFFTYYQFLPDFAREHSDYDFLFRPHPLALQHFQETGELTREQADAFCGQCQRLPNVEIDREKEYAATFWGTSVLISDISGIIPEYFVTGKPLIFCASNMHLTPEKTTARILEGSYIVNNAEELEACLTQLKQGIDPLLQKRQQIITELYSADLSAPEERIVKYLAEKL